MFIMQITMLDRLWTKTSCLYSSKKFMEILPNLADLTFINPVARRKPSLVEPVAEYFDRSENMRSKDPSNAWNQFNRPAFSSSNAMGAEKSSVIKCHLSPMEVRG